jgi:SAM-dependent methyltransferase
MRWCELGCGNGVTAAVAAASNPAADVHAIDINADHIDFATKLRDRAGISNLSLHCAAFADAALAALPKFDYIVAHGVYTWIDEATRRQLRAFVDRHLAPGGLFYVSYNALPGWAANLPLAGFVRAAARVETGNSAERFAAAADLATALTAAGARSLVASPMARSLIKRRATMDPAYFPHEFLPEGWEPRYVTDVRAEFAELGLEPIGSAYICDNFDVYSIGKPGRAALEGIADPNLRELARDYFRVTGFRRDVFGRDVRRFDNGTRRERLMRTTFHLSRPPSLIGYSMRTPAGTVTFDTPIARAIVDALAGGPAPLTALDPSVYPPADVLANALALTAADHIRPVSGAPADVTALNRALRATGARFSYRLSPYGTAIPVDARPEGDGGESPVESHLAWTTFFAAQGMATEAAVGPQQAAS